MGCLLSCRRLKSAFCIDTFPPFKMVTFANLNNGWKACQQDLGMDEWQVWNMLFNGKKVNKGIKAANLIKYPVSLTSLL